MDQKNTAAAKQLNYVGLHVYSTFLSATASFDEFSHLSTVIESGYKDVTTVNS